jgi:type 1 glutamine amidotransferase
VPDGRALILCGHSRYSDPYHDFPATSQQIASVLADCGVEARVRGDRPEALRDLAPDELLVVNAGGGVPAHRLGEAGPEWREFHRALVAHLSAGGPVLGVHTASAAFADVPEWSRALGGRWVPDVSWHPPIGRFAVSVRTGEHPITAGVPDFSPHDERYSGLEVAPDARVLAHHDLDGTAEPLLWVREEGGARVGYDALGHGVESYHGATRRLLLQRTARWLLSPAALSARRGAVRSAPPRG